MTSKRLEHKKLLEAATNRFLNSGKQIEVLDYIKPSHLELEIIGYDALDGDSAFSLSEIIQSDDFDAEILEA